MASTSIEPRPSKPDPGQQRELGEAVVLGAGPAGLASAAVLKRSGLAPVVIEKGARVGCSWRSRHPALRLNSLGWLSRLPDDGRRWRFGHYPSRDEWIAYLEGYAERHSLSLRFSTEALHVERAPGGWRVLTSRGTIEAPVVVVATGYDRVPWMPDWPGIERFGGEVLHAAGFRSASDFRDKRVMIAGAGVSGVEIAGLVAGVAGELQVSMRTPPNLITRTWRGIPLHFGSVVLDLLPAAISDRLGRAVQRMIFGDLSRYGLPKAPLGIKSSVRERGVGPAVDDGFVQALTIGLLELVPPIARFEQDAVILSDGRRVSPDVVIAATGYRRGLGRLVGHLGILDPDGRPLRRGTVVRGAPGLHFVGFDAGVRGPLREIRAQALRLPRMAADPGSVRMSATAAWRPESLAIHD